MDAQLCNMALVVTKPSPCLLLPTELNFDITQGIHLNIMFFQLFCPVSEATGNVVASAQSGSELRKNSGE